MIGIVTARAVQQWQRLRALGYAPPWWRFGARRRWVAAVNQILDYDCSQMAEMLRDVYPLSMAEELRNQPHPTFAKMRKNGHSGPWVVPVEYKSFDQLVRK